MTILPYGPGDYEQSAASAAHHLAHSGVISYPTETVYGFGTLLRDYALERLAELKGRQDDKPFLLLVRSPEELPELEWTDAARALAAKFWPGPLTIALRVSGKDFPARVLGPRRTVAVRVSPHPGVAALLAAIDAPLTSTSANRPGDPPARSAQEVSGVLRRAGFRDVVVLDGGTLPNSLPSTLVDCIGPLTVLRRPGEIQVEELRAVVPDLQV